MSAIWNALDNREKALLLWIVVLTERCRTPSEKIQLTSWIPRSKRGPRHTCERPSAPAG
jgi:hypothetical protein